MAWGLYLVPNRLGGFSRSRELGFPHSALGSCRRARAFVAEYSEHFVRDYGRVLINAQIAALRLLCGYAAATLQTC